MINIILQASNSIFFAMLFLLPGTLLAAILFRGSENLTLLKRAVFGICLSASLFALVNAANYAIGLRSVTGGAIEYACIVAALLLARARSSGKEKAGNDKKSALIGTAEAVRVALVAAFGTAWKLLFILPISNIGSAYDYANKFAKGTVPDLGFYTGMASDHANYSFGAARGFWMHMQAAMTNPGFDISLFLITFAFLGFVYILCLEYFADRRHALFATAIMAFGPFEIFYTSSGIFGHPLAYLAMFSLFLLFRNSADRKENPRGRFWLAASLCLAMAATYYTSTIANILACAGFCIAVFVEKQMRRNGEPFLRRLSSAIKDRRLADFVLIAAISGAAFFAISNDMLVFTNDLIRDTTAIKSTAAITVQSTTTVSLGSEILRPYRDPAIFGISAIRAQAILFILFGTVSLAAIAFRAMRKKKSGVESSAKESAIALALIPAALASFAFIYAGYPARAFDYFGFLAPLLLAISFSQGLSPSDSPRKIAFAKIAIFAMMIPLSIQTMQDKRIYFERPAGEIEGASWIAKHLDGKVLSDQAFVSQIISNGYYDVTGTSDTDPRLSALFYQNDASVLLAAATSSLGIDYIATTKRMRESYILMLDIPQIPIQNSAMIDAALEKVYDNGDVRIYATGLKKKQPSKRK